MLCCVGGYVLIEWIINGLFVIEYEVMVNGDVVVLVRGLVWEELGIVLIKLYYGILVEVQVVSGIGRFVYVICRVLLVDLFY